MNFTYKELDFKKEREREKGEVIVLNTTGQLTKKKSTLYSREDGEASELGVPSGLGILGKRRQRLAPDLGCKTGFRVDREVAALLEPYARLLVAAYLPRAPSVPCFPVS